MLCRPERGLALVSCGIFSGLIIVQVLKNVGSFLYGPMIGSVPDTLGQGKQENFLFSKSIKPHEVFRRQLEFWADWLASRKWGI